MKKDVKKITRLAILCALSITLLYLVRFPIIPAASFLVYEPADVPILIGTFMYGPLAGLAMTGIVALIQALTTESVKDGWFGFAMHVMATGTLVMVAGMIYKKMHTFKGAIFALIAGALSMTFIMIPANLFLTPLFYGMPINVVKGLLLPAIIPFNLLKSFINSAIVLLAYKSLSKVLRKEGLFHKKHPID